MARRSRETDRDMQEFTDALREAVDQLRDFSTATERGTQGTARRSAAGRAASTVAGAGANALGFAANATMRAGRNFAMRTAMGAAAQQIEVGGSFSGSVTSAALEAGSRIPIIGSIFGDITQPLKAAQGRVTSITGMVARAGGQVSDEFRRDLAIKFTKEEKRARDEAKKVSALFKDDPTLKGIAMQDTTLGAGLDALASALSSIESMMKTVMAGGAVKIKAAR
jgi:hypothetical protein